MLGSVTMSTPTQLLRMLHMRKYSKPNWKEYKVKIDVNTPFEQMKKKEIERFDVWEVDGNGKMFKLVQGNNRKQAVIRGMQMGVIKGEGQYKLMKNTNPINWNWKKAKKWKKFGIRNKKRGKSPRKRTERKAWSKFKSKSHKRRGKHT